jgi:hypothetical protein
MAVHTDAPWTPDAMRLVLTIDVYEHGDRMESVGLTGRDIDVIRRFFAQAMTGDHVSPALRETLKVLNRAVYESAANEGWDDAEAGKPRRSFHDPLFRDGYNEGYDSFQQQKGAA